MDFMLTKEIVRRITKGATQYRAGMEEMKDGKPLSEAFKKEFCTYYGMDSYSPYKDEAWREIYFGVFEQARNDKEVSFEKILKTLYEKTENRVEASFAGKIIANIDMTKPVWDNAVLKNLHSEYQEVPAKFSVGANKEKGLEDAVKVYNAIVESIEELSKTIEAEDYIRDFDALCYDFADFPKEKKIELYLCAKK